MRYLTLLRMLILGVSALVWVAPARSDGLVYRLPEDGAWAQYDMQLRIGAAGTGLELKGQVKISSVGVETVGDEKCRWLEIRVDLKADGREQIVLNKALIPEKHLGRGKAPVENIIRAWNKTGDEEVKSLTDMKSPQAGVFQILLTGPDANATKLEPITLENAKLGKLESAGELATREYDQSQTKVKATYEHRLSDKAPFGVVSTKIKFQGGDGGGFGEGEVTLTLVDVGDTALTELPNSR